MRELTLFLVCSLFLFNVSAQKKAVTETGQEVVLYEDGTWKYLFDIDNPEKKIKTSSKKYKKPPSSSFLLKSNKIKMGFWLDPKVWSFKKSTDNLEAEYELQLKDGDLYGMIITEQIEIPLSSLKNIVLENGRVASPDIHIVKEEYRIVNGIKVLMLQMNGTIQGIKFSYYGYYYSNKNGTVQFMTYTSQNLLKEYFDKYEGLLNGLVQLD